MFKLKTLIKNNANNSHNAIVIRHVKVCVSSLSLGDSINHE